MPIDQLDSSVLGLTQGDGGNSLQTMLSAADISIGDEPSYQLCKTIYLYHPLGAKMAESPITMAQSQERNITCQGAPPEVITAYRKKWEELTCDDHILNTHAQARVYGITSVVLGIEGKPSDEPADMPNLYKEEFFFNVADPLNTAGSLVLSQVTNSPFFQKSRGVRLNNEWFHLSRCQVVMNERPIFISYTNSAFGFVGRSVYQRALFPLKSFLKSMYADDKIMSKLALIIAKLKAPGAIINQAMMKVAAWKRTLLKWAISGQVASIDPDEEITAIDMTNVQPAGEYARTNILKNIATAGDMPAKLLENETMVAGFGEGTEDAKNIARYVDRIRLKMRPTYQWFNNIVQYVAWTPIWYRSEIQSKYPEYKNKPFEEAFLEWRNAFIAEWPSVLIEPESEEIKKEEVKLEAVIAILNTLLPILDPANKATLIKWACDCFGENKRLFPNDLDLDMDGFEDYTEEQQAQAEEVHDTSIEGEKANTKATAAKSNVKKFPSFKDSIPSRHEVEARLARLRGLAEGLNPDLRHKLTA